MLIELFAAVSAAVAAAGLVLLIGRLGRMTGRWTLPKWAMPAAAGAAMFGFAIWNEYSWFPRTRAALSADLVVASAPADRMAYRPWTYIFPLVTRFVAVDRSAAVAGAEVFATNAYVVTRWGRTRQVPIAFDCARMTRADLAAGARLAADGTLTGAEWLPPDAEDPLVRAACMGG